jgi:hypothetical protein
MLFIDYQWDLSSSGMLLDPELELTNTGWVEGDYFQLQRTNDRYVLKRMPKLEKFLLDGVQQNVEKDTNI